jgi:hypothetical protein
MLYVFCLFMAINLALGLVALFSDTRSMRLNASLNNRTETALEQISKLCDAIQQRQSIFLVLW